MRYNNLRTIRQTRIRFSLAVGNYEITSRQADYVLKLLKAEKELLMVIPKGWTGMSHRPETSPRIDRYGQRTDRTIYGLYLAGCIDGGQCDIKEIVRILNRCSTSNFPYLQPVYSDPQP